MQSRVSALPRFRAPVRIGVLVSGHGTNLQSILDGCARGEIPGRVVVVASTTAKAYALVRARQAAVPAVVLAPRSFPDRQTYDARLAEVLQAHDVDLVCLAGFLRILTPRFVDLFRGRIMNIHPALLPAFGGVGMYGPRVHDAVLASGAKISGCTVHFVDETPDGGPIILQAAVPVHDDDSVDSLAARIAEREHHLYPEAIRLFAGGRLQMNGKRVRITRDAAALVPS
ncbi:MAG: phosphoribosylglycinamide formyltransferase [Armatimonadetes bacterium 13_1_40CM_3_65_7]|nr:MAG: phosphoribosylglycinamide formyltransferase [Armatimonadetes bacterium 13_1_40CM_3_65_7]